MTKGPPRCHIDTSPDFSRLRDNLCRLTCGILQTSIGEGYAQLNLPIGPVLFGPLSVSGGNTNRRHVNAAITAGLALTMTVGSVPPQAFAEMMQGDTTQVVAEQSDATGAAAASEGASQTTSQDQSEDNIASFANLNELHVAEGSDATLPQTVTATYESGATKQENVIWKLNGADAPATLAQLPAGSYEFEGTVDGTTQTVKHHADSQAARSHRGYCGGPGSGRSGGSKRSRCHGDEQRKRHYR